MAGGPKSAAKSYALTRQLLTNFCILWRHSYLLIARWRFWIKLVSHPDFIVIHTIIVHNRKAYVTVRTYMPTIRAIMKTVSADKMGCIFPCIGHG